MPNSAEEQERIELLAAKQRLNHVYTGNPPPEDDYWASLLYYGSPVEKYGYDNPVVQPISQPFNPDEVGIASLPRNNAASDAETDKQQGYIKSAYWNAFVNGVYNAIPGIGPALASQRLAGGTLQYPFKVEDRPLAPRFNPEDTGIAQLTNNKRSAAAEEDKQGGVDWTLLLPANWIKTVADYLAAEEAAKTGGGLPATMAEDIKGAGTNVANTAKDAAKSGKKVVDFLGGDPAPDSSFDFINWLSNNPMIALAVGGIILLVLIIK